MFNQQNRFDLLAFFSAHLLLVAWLFWGEFHLSYLLGALWGYSLIIIGQEAGAHRLFAHSGFTPKVWAEWLCSFMATVSCYGSVPTWCNSHALHHANSDRENDPTDPRRLGVFKLFSNLWKLQHPDPSPASLRVSAQVMKRKPVKWMFEYYISINVAWIAFIACFGFDALVWFWAIPVLMLSYFMNSISWFCHQDEFDGRDMSSNSRFINLLSPGTGFHKNHHKNPRAYRFGSPDLAAWVIEKFLSVKA